MKCLDETLKKFVETFVAYKNNCFPVFQSYSSFISFKTVQVLAITR